MIVYVLKTWVSDGYERWDYRLEVYSDKRRAEEFGKWLQEDYYLVNGEDADKCYYQVTERKLR